jgi:hypothetical protein
LSVAGSPITTSGTLAITLSGTALPVANGGTGLTTLTANYIPYGNGTSAFNSSSTFTYNGTSLTAGNFIPSSSTTPTNGIYLPAANNLGFATNSTEFARIDPAGNLLVGTTTASSGSTAGHIQAGTGINVRAGSTGAYGGNLFNINWTGSPQLWIDTTNVGTITIVSDYRIKKNIKLQTIPALNRVMQLRPVAYERTSFGKLYIDDGVIREGFIAHELQSIIPSAVEGAKDDPNQIQSLNLDALCSVLVKAIQEIKTEFDAYVASHP